MMDWKKIAGITTLVVLLLSSGFGLAAWIFKKGGQSESITKNANMAPKVAEDLRIHEDGDKRYQERLDRKAIVDSMRDIQFTNALIVLTQNVDELKEAVKENTRAMQFDKFNRRKGVGI